MATLDGDDVGKSVLDSSGSDIGMIVEVTGDTMYVEPDSGITDEIKTSLGFSGGDKDSYPLDESRVAAVTDDEVRLG